MKRQKMLKELIEWFSSHEQARLDVEKFIGLMIKVLFVQVIG